jgi:hypothetical protein
MAGDLIAATDKNWLIENGFMAILTVAIDLQIEPTEGIEHLAKGINGFYRNSMHTIWKNTTFQMILTLVVPSSKSGSRKDQY